MMEVDVAKVLESKNPKLARRVPKFLIEYLRRIIHEEELNYVLRNYSALSPEEFIRATLSYMGISYRAVGMERLDPTRRYVFASNHPFGGLDGLMLADEVSRYMGDVRVVVNDILMYLEPLKPIFVPVNKHGRQNDANVRAFNEAFESDLPIITFPAGLCSRRIGGEVVDLPWKRNFVKKAIATNRDIVPVHFDGVLSDFFYRLSNIRKFFGIKANIEMLYLADEMFRQRGSQFDILIGEPIQIDLLKDRFSMDEIVETVRKKSYELKKCINKRIDKHR